VRHCGFIRAVRDPRHHVVIDRALARGEILAQARMRFVAKTKGCAPDQPDL
jgi:hypothetical protein